MATFKQRLKLWYRARQYRKADKAEIDWMMRQLAPGDTAFDVGAHKGAYTYWMLKAVGDEGIVVAFEPQPEGIVLLRSLFRDDAEIEQLGLSDKKGDQFFYVQPQADAVSYEASLENKYPDAKEHVISTTTLDDYCRMRRLEPRLLKIDVEGHEAEVIAGGCETLQRFHPFLLIEIEERHIGRDAMQALFGRIESLGYAGYFFVNGVKTPLAQFDASVHQAPHLLTGKAKGYINNFVFEPKP